MTTTADFPASFCGKKALVLSNDHVTPCRYSGVHSGRTPRMAMNAVWPFLKVWLRTVASSDTQPAAGVAGVTPRRADRGVVAPWWLTRPVAGAAG